MRTFSWLKNLKSGRLSGLKNGHKRRPAWQRHTAPPVESLETRCLLTTTLAAIQNVTLFAGSPLHIALNGSDTEGQVLSFTASSSNPTVSTFIPQGNRSLKVSVLQGTIESPVIQGDMTFQLFEDRSPRATNRIIQLTESDFYNGSIFHRVLNNFVVQGGDPNGVPPGTGGSTLGVFDDQFHPDLQHNTTGMLSMAKSFDDTNDSQFFIAEFNAANSGSVQSLRGLDSQHTVFGMQTTGESIRAAISEVATDVNSRPTSDVVLTDVSIFVDIANGVLMLSAPEGTQATTTVITVTVSDTEGNMAQRTFNVTVEPDPFDNQPWLLDIPAVRTLVNVPTSFQLTAFDVEGSAAAFLDEVFLDNFGLTVPVRKHANVNYAVDASTGLVSFTPTNGLVTSTAASPGGTTEVTVAAGVVTTGIDYQVVGVEIVDAAIPLIVSAADHPNQTEADDGDIDTFTLSRSGTKIRISINGQLVQQAEDISVSSLTIVGSGDDDTLIVDYSGGNPIPSGGLVFAAGTQTIGDTLRIIGGTVTTATYSLVNATDGVINLDTSSITFTGVEPIVESLTATNRVFTFSNADDTIVVGDDDVLSNGLSRISATGTARSIDFKTPTGKLTINAGAGHDNVNVGNLETGPIAVTVTGGDGNDTVLTSTGKDSITGGEGDDVLVGGGGNDTIDGGNGNDNITGASGADVIRTGAGNDTVSGGTGNDTVTGGTGDDSLDGGADIDQLIETISGSLILTPTGSSGSNGTDAVLNFESAVITAGADADTIDAGAVSIPVTAIGSGGNDTIVGGSASDSLDGGDGADVIIGGLGDDILVGGAGNDVLLGSGGKDDLRGDAGDDFLRGQGTSGDTLRGGPGNDTLDGGPGDDILIDSNNADFVLTNTSMTGNGNDTIISVERAFLVGGASNNKLDASAFFTPLFTTVTLDGAGGNDSLVGTAGNDILFDGTEGDDTMLAGAGNDYLFGGSGKDYLDGQEGDDTVRGQGGSGDTVIGGPGNDFIDGGSGGDRLIEFISGTATATNTSLISSQGNDAIFNIEFLGINGSEGNDVINISAFDSQGLNTLVGGGGNDTLTGSASGTNLIVGGNGNDEIIGGNSFDILDGQDGDDSISGGNFGDSLTGGLGNDTINGGDGDDTIQAGDGNDSVTGGSGNDGISLGMGTDSGFGGDDNDTLYGGSGNDTLLGSAGNDVLVGGLDDDLLDGEDGTQDTLVLGRGDGVVQAGDVAIDTAEVDNAFMLNPLPPWVEEV